MGKLTLNLDQLTVDSFDTSTTVRPKGTVFGEQCTCPSACTCPGCPTCDASCNGSCGETCADTCWGTCNTCMYTCNTTGPITCNPTVVFNQCCPS